MAKINARRYQSLAERLEANSVISPSGCRLWVGAIKANGYGCINVRVGGKLVQKCVHRVAFEYYVRELAPDEEVDHKCRVRNCIEWQHLEAVTHKENMVRMAARRKATTATLAIA